MGQYLICVSPPVLTSSNPWGKIYIAYHIPGYLMCMYAKNVYLGAFLNFDLIDLFLTLFDLKCINIPKVILCLFLT